MSDLKRFLAPVTAVALILLGVGFYFRFSPGSINAQPAVFDADRAYESVVTQVSFGPRIRGQDGHRVFLQWATAALTDAGWDVAFQEAEYMNYPATNIIAKKGAQADAGWVILGAHYDSRMFADRDADPGLRNLPVPGANDGASGVAVLLEIARVLPDLENKEVWIVLFDAEDNGDIEGRPWIIGSTAFVRDLDLLNPGRTPEAVVIIDMIGDADLNIHMENYSDRELSDQLWSLGAEAGYGGQLIPSRKFSMLDDHTPFLRADIRTVLMIDFDYPYWHTTEDTPDKVAPESLKAVGDTLLMWLQK